MQWLNSLDQAVDRVLINPNEEDESVQDESHNDAASIHSDPGPQEQDESILQTRHLSNLSSSLIQRIDNIHNAAVREEESDHFVVNRRTEQTPGQDSTSAPPLTAIEPESSMLVDEVEANNSILPTSEPSSSSEPFPPITLRDFSSSESEQQRSPRTATMQESRTLDSATIDAPSEYTREDIRTSDTDVKEPVFNSIIQRTGDDDKVDDSNDIFRGQSDKTTSTPLHTADTETSNVSNPNDESEPCHLNVSFEDDEAGDEDDVPAQVIRQAEGDNEFDVSLPLPSWDLDEPLDPWLNCYGVVHVRLFCAQRLPCPVGSSVQGIVALPPWKGRVRTERTDAFLGPTLNHGVCVRWDQLQDAGYCSMVNSWNSLENPTPTISIDLVFHPLQMLEFPMCNVKLSCAPLMKDPGEWKKQWCQATFSQKINDSEGFLEADERVPLILLEAMFMPSGMDEGEAEEELLEEEEDSSIGAHPSSIGASTPTTIRSRKRGEGSVGTGASYLLTQRTKSHLLRIESLWIPATCSVCQSVIMGWKSAYRCEACNIDCCKDCQLQVDLQVPCGSSIAEDAVAAAFHNKLTVQNMLSVMAPWDETAQKTSRLSQSKHITRVGAPGSQHTGRVASNDAAEKEQGIGTLQMHVARACVFAKALHPESNPDDVFKDLEDQAARKGDYYVRLTSSGNDQSRRTRTIQNTGKPQFDSEELLLNVPNYGVEYRIDLVDAYSDKPVGMAVVTAQGLLQHQRDAMVTTDGFAVINPFRRPASCTEKRRWRLELRTGVKNGDYFASTKGGKAGEIVGWIDVDLCLTEAVDQLYSSIPIECPPRPPDGLNVELFHAHIARIGTIIGDIKKGLSVCSYVISWENPPLTSLSLILFVTFCLRFNAEYIASLPPFFLVVYMVYLAATRKAGGLKERFIERETTACLQSEKKVAVKYSLYRPIGRLHIAVHRGRNIRSRELGLPGSAGSRIYWDPFRYCENDKKKASILSVDSSMSAPHEIGWSNFQYSTSPEWNVMYGSEETKRLQQLIPSQGEFFATNEDISGADAVQSSLETNKQSPVSCIFPVLQPIRPSKQRKGSVHGKGRDQDVVELDAWESTTSAVVMEVRFQDVLNKLPGFDDVLGEVAFPVSQIIKDGEIRGWYRVADADSASGSRLTNGYGRNLANADTVEDGQAAPEVYLEIKWIPPESNEDNIDSEREASIVIAEEMIRSASQAQNRGIDLMGSSIGAFNTVTGLSGHVHMIQNALGSTLDMLESIRNAFNFTDPYKSSIVFCGVVLLWLFLAVVPLRALILLGGLGMYASTFSAAFFPSTSTSAGETSTTDESTDLVEQRAEKKEAAVGIWIKNAIRGLPTDEDLRKAYFWESRRIGEEARASLADQKRTTRLQKLWRAQWYATVQLKTHHEGELPREGRDWHWADAFAIIQGHRFLWWPSARDFDNGEPPAGRIFLAGHAGLAGLSPLEARQMNASETPLVVSIFGRGLNGQQKLTILTDSVASKEALERAVLEASTKQD